LVGCFGSKAVVGERPLPAKSRHWQTRYSITRSVSSNSACAISLGTMMHNGAYVGSGAAIGKKHDLPAPEASRKSDLDASSCAGKVRERLALGVSRVCLALVGQSCRNDFAIVLAC
jgi:hypothetical protein